MSVPAASPPSTPLALRFAQRAGLRARRERWARLGLATAAVLLGLLVLAMPLFLLVSARAAPGWSETLVPLLAGSLKAAGYAMLVAVPLGLGSAIWCARFAAPPLRRVLKPLFELFEAVPAVVLGLIAALVLAPWLAQKVLSLAIFLGLLPLALALSGLAWQQFMPKPWQRRLQGREAWLLLPPLLLLLGLSLQLGVWLGNSGIAALLQPQTPWNGLIVGLMLGLAVMPTVFTLAEEALFGVPAELASAAQALGATRWQALWWLVLPVAGPGVLAALLLGLSRALGETMIVLMASGNTPLLEASPLSGLRSIAANLALEAPQAADGSAQFGLLLYSALLLFVLCLVLNALAEVVRARLRQRLAGL